MLVIEKPELKLLFYINIQLFQFSGNGLSSKHLGEVENFEIVKFLTNIRIFQMILLIAQI